MLKLNNSTLYIYCIIPLQIIQVEYQTDVQHLNYFLITIKDSSLIDKLDIIVNTIN